MYGAINLKRFAIMKEKNELKEPKVLSPKQAVVRTLSRYYRVPNALDNTALVWDINAAYHLTDDEYASMQEKVNILTKASRAEIEARHLRVRTTTEIMRKLSSISGNKKRNDSIKECSHELRTDNTGNR